MQLGEQYQRQAAWRRWEQVLDLLPLVPGQTVLDLGCAIGDQSALLAARGARVIGIDGNAELLAAARARGLANVQFELGELARLDSLALPPADGLWCSFAVAYMLPLEVRLREWMERLRPGAWIALIEIDDLFAHEPLLDDLHVLLDGFVSAAYDASHYDFCCGRKLGSALRQLGCTEVIERVIADDELAFAGAASSEVLEAWAQRLDRMKGLQAHAGPHFERLRSELLACLASPEHVSKCQVYFVLARR
jgi:SAM-dependent methyltransferase